MFIKSSFTNAHFIPCLQLPISQQFLCKTMHVAILQNRLNHFLEADNIEIIKRIIKLLNPINKLYKMILDKIETKKTSTVTSYGKMGMAFEKSSQTQWCRCIWLLISYFACMSYEWVTEYICLNTLDTSIFLWMLINCIWQLHVQILFNTSFFTTVVVLYGQLCVCVCKSFFISQDFHLQSSSR